MMIKSKTVKFWLLTGVIMLFVQVILGGITRITGSGLSITKWDIIMGSIPPIGIEEWTSSFDLYKDSPQYKKINGGMSLSDFKFIFFWEFIHRLWARIMGFVFLLPFVYFVYKRMLGKHITYRLIIVFVLSAITASFGWIMVASGLLDRPWVNAYKLSFHLLLAFITYNYLLWTFFLYAFNKQSIVVDRGGYNLFLGFNILVWLQIFLGGLVSGMKAGLFYNTWPSMSGSFIPPVLLEAKEWTFKNMTLYDEFLFAPSLIQFVHRCTAYILVLFGLVILYKLFRSTVILPLRSILVVILVLLLLQVSIGISILLLSHGSIPVFIGVLHQAIAFILLGISSYIIFKISYEKH